ncbi:MAG TPA: hypothetical protein VHM30_14275 [Gemmatimonadaceae bacterium]|nr:hypothetical protein [Gemmatimonadaceae bacterium]
MPPRPRRELFDFARKFVADHLDDDPLGLNEEFAPPRLTVKAITSIPIMSRSRERILNNLDEMYREAFERAKATGDSSQMAALDFAYRREQLYFEILLDVRDAIERK